MITRLMRLIFVAMLIASTLTQFGPVSAAAQSSPNSWTEPAGAFTVQWQEPWVVQRQESGLLLVANGSTAAVATTSFPSDGLNPALCLDAYVDASLGPEVSAQPPFMEGKTSWRAYAAYENLQIGAVDYFECQVTPDGKSLALFVGGTTLIEKYGGIPMLIDFLGQWIVRPAGESGPVVAGDGWRLDVVDWRRGPVSVDLGLDPQPIGTDYLVVVADLTNWQGSGAELPLASIAALTSAPDASIPVDVDASMTVAESLGEVPIEQTIALDQGASRRIVLVFSVDGKANEVGISLAGNAALLGEDSVSARLVVLPSPAILPATQSGVVSNVIDGSTLLVELADTGQSARVRLIGVGDAGEEAASYLSSFIGQPVTLEPDPAHPDDNRLQRYVWITAENGLPAMANDLLIEQGMATYALSGAGGRFDAMLATANGQAAPAAGAEAPATQVPAEPDATDPADLSQADLAYLAELMRNSGNLRLSLEYYDLYMTSPTFDEAFFAHLGVIVLGWSVFCDGIARLEPTPQFTDLHARYLAACQPFDTLAHQIEPALDQMLAGEAPAQPFAGFDYDVMTSTVATARPALEQVLAEIDAVLEAAGIEPEAGPIR
jgi:endonuclease YncB( thermonuclease family)